MTKACELFGLESFGMIDTVPTTSSALASLDDTEEIKDLRSSYCFRQGLYIMVAVESGGGIHDNYIDLSQ